MEVIAVSFSSPSHHMVDGIRTLTSIVRLPSSSISLTLSGITGNSTAAHDGQVYIFFAHHYDYWAHKLGINRSAWDWCHWGENITFSCSPLLNENDFHLGDIWEIGSDGVRLQVCGSRVPCNKISWRCGTSAKWLKELADSGFCGVYMRILAGGIVMPGDRARMVESHPENVSCAAISKLAFDGSLKTKDTLNLLAYDPSLIGMNRSLVRRKLSVIEDAELLGKNAWKGWRAFKPVRIAHEGSQITSFYLQPVDGKPLATYLPGQFLTVKLPCGLIRNWSISDWNSPSNPEYYRISVKKAKNGSAWMHDSCSLETILQLRSPAGIFHLDWTPMFPGRQVYISAGIGATPILAMIKAHLQHYAMRLAPAIWIHVCRDGADMPSLLSELDTGDGTVQHVIFFTKPRPEDVHGEDYHFSGRPNAEKLKELIIEPYTINPLKITPIEIPGLQSTFYICGTASFEAEIKAGLAKAGVNGAAIHSESFNINTSIVVPSVLKSGRIRFTKSDRTVKWGSSGARSLSLLEIAEEAGLVAEYGCRIGSCGSCRVVLTKGEVAGGLQLDGSVLICCSRPASTFIEIEM